MRERADIIRVRSAGESTFGASVGYYDSSYGVPTRPGAGHHHGEEGEAEAAIAQLAGVQRAVRLPNLARQLLQCNAIQRQPVRVRGDADRLIRLGGKRINDLPTWQRDTPMVWQSLLPRLRCGICWHGQRPVM